MRMELLSVNVGLPQLLGVWQGEPISSGIRKFPVGADSVAVRSINIDGDGQADRTLHGGPDKAVYAYPTDHWPWWYAQHDFETAPASFGENLTLRGADETEVRIGDRFSWGAHVVLEVSQPRAPCFKFALLTGREDLSAYMTVTAKSGWYFRVLQAGTAPTRGLLERLNTDQAQPTVHEAFVAVYHPRVASDVVQRVLDAPSLAEVWRAGLVRRLKAAGYGASGS
ncbi:MAG: MOSC domain-containing protein [Micropepsaceae bacterium]